MLTFTNFLITHGSTWWSNMTLTCSVYLMNYLCSPCWKDLSKNYIILFYSTKNTSYSVIWLYFQWQSLIPSSRTSRNALESIIHNASNFLIVHLTALKPIMGHLYNNTTSLSPDMLDRLIIYLLQVPSLP